MKTKVQNPFIHFLVGLIFLIAAILVERGVLVFILPAPSGSDPGNWLTFAKELTGAHIRLADWSYPPLMPSLLRVLLALINPIAALKVLGLACWIFLAHSFFWVLKLSFYEIPFYLLICISLLFALAGYNGEIFAFGGYPQILGLCFIIQSIFFVNEWMAGKGKNLIFASLFTQFVVYTHHLMAAILVIMVAILFVWHLMTAKGNRKEILRRMVIFTIINSLLLMLALPIYLRYYEYLAVNPLNTNGFDYRSFTTLLEYVFRDGPIVWGGLMAISLLAVILNPRHKFAGIVFSFMFGGVITFLVTWEVRVFQVVLTGICFGAALALYSLWKENQAEQKYNRLLKPLTTILLALAMIWIANSSRHTFAQAIDFYEVVDQPTYSGLVWIKENTLPGEIVGVSNWTPFFLGWWVEGFSERPAIYAADLRWLAFDQERFFAQNANRLFSNTISVMDARDLIYQFHIKWLLVDKEYKWENLDPLISEQVVLPSFENERVMIFQVR